MEKIIMPFRISGLKPDPFEPLFGLSDEALGARGILRYRADESSSFPDRIEMRHALPGETVLLLNHTCQPAATPYRTTHAIFVREGARETFDRIGVVPEVMRTRLLSLRAFDSIGMIIDADVVEGEHLELAIERFFSDPAVSYIHAHNAKRGCYSGRIDRVTQA
jgi:hypothetical protein